VNAVGARALSVPLEGQNSLGEGTLPTLRKALVDRRRSRGGAPHLGGRAVGMRVRRAERRAEESNTFAERAAPSGGRLDHVHPVLGCTPSRGRAPGAPSRAFWMERRRGS
jgi:hypothetical protein